MDRSARRLPDPLTGSPLGERRRCIRQKLHTPVYASFNGPQSGMVVDLSELLDLHEEGFAVQTSERLEVNRAVTLCLDLPETRGYIHGSGEVIWSDDSGRGGIRFSALPESSRRILKEWLFANLLIGCSNHAARAEQLARREQEKSPEPVPVEFSVNESASELANGSVGKSVNAVLQLITERALRLTGASGAALAFLADDKMICRARAGEPAPPLGAPVDVKHGLSGECVRGGLLVSCDDTENDPHVDPEVCRVLGIGSLMAAPIVSDFRVVGLLEVFSPRVRWFTKAHETVLGRLVELIPQTHPEKAHPEKTQPESAQPEETQKETRPETPIPAQLVSKPVLEEVAEPAPAAPRLLYSRLLGLVVVAVLTMVVGYLVGPAIERRWADSTEASSQHPVVETVSGHSATGRNAYAKSLSDLQRLADEGDADAQYQMGVRYHSGEDVPHDDAQAMQWFQRAAEQGNVNAQSALGAYYWAGRGVPEDLSKAYFWSAIALAEGDENSKARLQGLASQMTQAEVSKARQDADAWIHTHSQRAKSEAN